METIKVGIREFRADLAEHIAASTPVAVTRHGQTVGYFIPAQGQNEGDIAALKKAGKTLDRLLAEQGVELKKSCPISRQLAGPPATAKRRTRRLHK